MKMKTYEDLKDKFCEMLEEVSRKSGWSTGDVELCFKASTTLKNLNKIMMYDEDCNQGYSRGMGNWEARGTYDHGNSYGDGGYDDDMSGRRGRRGGYSRDGGMMSMRNNNRRYSRDDGRDYMKDQLREMMNSAEDDSTRDVLRRAMKQLDEA